MLSYGSTVFLVVAVLLAVGRADDEPNPPVWPESVKYFAPSDDPAVIQKAVNEAYSDNGGYDPPCHGQWSDKRFAFLFAPGQYKVDVPVGYYTTVHGLGASPDDTTFEGVQGVYAEEGAHDPSSGALSNFWRGAENLRVSTQYPWTTGTGMLWAVSQASPLRRVHVDGDLVLFQYEPPWPNAGEASGGYAADLRVDGTVRPGSQQQWLTVSSTIANWTGGLWNMVFLGVDGAPSSHCGPQPSGLAQQRVAPTLGGRRVEPALSASLTPCIVNVGEAPLVLAKPYLRTAQTNKTTTTKTNKTWTWTWGEIKTVSGGDGDRMELVVPAPRSQATGPDWASTGATVVPFEHVYVASADHDTSSSLNAKLAEGKHLLLSPGIYSLDAPLQLNTSGQVLLGIGLATLVSTAGTAVITVGNVDGVRVAGVLLQAGPKPTPALLEWGDGSYGGSATAPGGLHDVYARVGGPDTTPVQAESMVVIRSGHVVGDNVWLWRADHAKGGVLVKNGDNPVANGLEVYGDDVTFVGLAAEHTLADVVYWSGERGATYFCQIELAYDVNQSYADTGYVGYHVAPSVSSHDAYGVGVYHYFRDFEVTMPTVIRTPAALESRFRSPLAVYLTGKGTAKHIINEEGDATGPSGGNGDVAHWCG